MNDLLAAAVFFVGTHLVISSTQLRPQLISRLGENGYRGLYSLVALVALLWMVLAYNRSDYQPFWFGGAAAEHVALLLMPVAVFLVVCGNSTANPTAVGQTPDPDAAEPARGIIRVTRHPTMWGVGLWAVLHVFANDDIASVIFFGAFAVLALAGAQVLDARRSRENAAGWGVFMQRTSFVPFAAILQGRQKFVWAEIGWMRVVASLALYVVLLVGHPWLGGVALGRLSMAAEPVIQARGLVKHFGNVEAVRGIDLDIPAGTCIGLLGPNGAGKTTTMRMLLGLTTPTAGEIAVMGEPAAGLSRAVRARIGLVPQETNLDPDLSVAENLAIYGRYYGLEPAAIADRVPELLRFMALEAKTDAKVMHLSGGMKRRLILARALIGDPDLLILDEPTTGLDPQARVMIWRQLQALKGAGKTMLLTTHYMDEAERLCDSIVLIDHGQVLDRDAPKGLIARHVKRHVLEVEKPVPESLPIMDMENLGQSVLFFLDDLDTAIDRMPAGHAFTHRPANLEDVFLRLTGRQLREN